MKTQVLSSLAAAAAFTLAGMLPLAAQAQATQLKPAAGRPGSVGIFYIGSRAVENIP